MVVTNPDVMDTLNKPAYKTRRGEARALAENCRPLRARYKRH